MGKLQKRRPPGLNLASVLQKESSFTLSDTGTFLEFESGFEISPRGIVKAPGRQADEAFSTLTLEDIEPLSQLGCGASATVRLARHKPSGRLLALKIINVVAQREMRRQIVNELKVLCGLQHRQLVPLYDAFYLEGYVYLALRYMDGGSLEHLLSAYQVIARQAGIAALGLPEQVLSAVLVQVSCGLRYLHDQANVVHRDLKPANVLINTTGTAALSDFGISKNLEDSRGMARSFVGTAAYMAPERISGGDHSAPSDIWSLGIISVECAQGYHPYRGAQSYYDLIVEIQDASSPPVLPTDCFSPSLCDLTAALVRPKPNERPSCAQLLAHPFLSGRSGHVAASGAAPDYSWLAGAAEDKLGRWIAETFGPSTPAPPRPDSSKCSANGSNGCSSGCSSSGSSGNSGNSGSSGGSGGDRGGSCAVAMALAASISASSCSSDGSAEAAAQLLPGEIASDSVSADAMGHACAAMGSNRRPPEAKAAMSIQAHLRGAVTRRELEELRELEAEHQAGALHAPLAQIERMHVEDPGFVCRLEQMSLETGS